MTKKRKKLKKRPFKKDAFSRARGGRSVFYDLYCSQCSTHILLYQKDGPGPLKRLYLDRILAPDILASLQHTSLSKNDVPNLRCSKCNFLHGTGMVYEKENRLAIHLVVGSFFKGKNEKGVFPPESKNI